MGTTAAQNIKITYNDFETGVGTEEDRVILDGFVLKEGRLDGSCTFSIVIFGLTVDETNDKVGAALTAYRARQKSLVIEIDGNEFRNYDHTGTAHKNLIGEASVVDNDLFTGLTRQIDVAITLNLPPIETNGRTETSTTIDSSCNGLRTLTVSAQYNATDAATATTLKSSDFNSYVSSVKTKVGVGSDWQFISENIQSENLILDTQLTVTRVYSELTHRVSITYGGFTVGDGVGGVYQVNGWSAAIGRLTATINFTVMVRSNSSGTLNSACVDLENAFRRRNVALSMSFNGGTYRTFTPSTVHVNFQGEATGQNDDCFSQNADGDGYFKRNYAVSLSGDMYPEGESLGRTEEAVNVVYAKSRAITVDITMSYNSVLGSGARALYMADADTYSNGILSEIDAGAEFELTDESFSTIPFFDNQISVKRTYVEIIFNQTGSIKNDPDLVDFQLRIQYVKDYPGDSNIIPVSGNNFATKGLTGGSSGGSNQSVVPGAGGGAGGGGSGTTAIRVVTVTFIVATWVDKNASTDLDDIYSSKIRPYLLKLAKDELYAKTIAVVNEDVTKDLSQNKLDIMFRCTVGSVGGKQLIESEMSVTVTLKPGKKIVGSHDGEKLSKFRIEVKAEKLRTIEIRKVYITSSAEPSITSTGDIPDSGIGWITTMVRETTKPKKLGNISKQGESFDILETTIVEDQEFITAPKSKAPTSGTTYRGKFT